MIDYKQTEIKFTDKLYGRDEELERMLLLYHGLATEESSLVLVKGSSGMGKSTLVTSFVNRLGDSSFYFVSGKQDLSKNNQPYSSILQAFNQLIDEWALESTQERERIIRVLNKQLGHHSTVILKVFPRLANFLGVQLPKDEPYLTFKDRFNEALLGFTNSLKHLDERIIFFLDDLQWADHSTLRFLELWLSEGKASNVFWVGAFRNDEDSGTSWQVNQGLQLNTGSDYVFSIKLNGLSLEVIREMCADIIEMKEDRILEFSELILQLTGGNPLFVKESILVLIEDGVLFFDVEKECWNYDVSQIKTFDKSSRTLEFIIRKLEDLSETTQELIGTGSAIGSYFNVAVLSAVTEKTYSDVVAALEPCVRRRVIECVSNTEEFVGAKQYRFTHDKMQNAAYSMLSEERKAWVHYSLGKTYSSSLGHAAQDRNIYDIVNQFNRCTTYFDTDKERLNLVKMNLQAGKKAKISSSFDQALAYFNNVIHIIESYDQKWKNEIVFEVYLESGEAAYLKSDFVSSVMFYESALKYATTHLQRAKVHHNFLVMYNGVSDIEAAWKSGLKVMELLGQNFPVRVGKGKVLVQFLKVRWLVRNIDPDILLNRHEIANEEIEQVLLTLMEMIGSAQNKKPEVSRYIVLKGFEIILKYGNTPVGYFAVSGYGAMLGKLFGRIEKGWEFIKMGGQLTEKYDSMAFHGRGNFGVYGTYSHLVLHPKNNLKPLEDAFDFSKGAGDYSTAAYSSIILLENMFAAGVSLDVIREKSSSYFNFLKRTANYDYLSSHKSVVTASSILMTGEEANQKMIARTWKRVNRVNSKHIKYTWRLYRLVTAIVFSDNIEAQKMVKEIDEAEYEVLSSVELIRVIFMSIARADEALSGSGISKNLSVLKADRKEVSKYAKVNPDNYGQILALLDALIAEVKGDVKKAIGHYQNAIEMADQYGFFHYKAVFCERLGHLFLKESKKSEGQGKLIEAKNAFVVWGANYKVHKLQSEISTLN